MLKLCWNYRFLKGYLNTVRDNTSIIDMDNNWNILLFKEAFYIKTNQSAINSGLKASRKLLLLK